MHTSFQWNGDALKTGKVSMTDCTIFEQSVQEKHFTFLEIRRFKFSVPPLQKMCA